MTTLRRDGRGMVLVVAAIAIALIAALGAAYLLSARTQSQRTQASEEAVGIMNIAEAGVAAALDDIRKGGTGDVAGSFGGGTYSVSAAQSGDFHTLSAAATLGSWSRAIEVVVKQVLEVTAVNARAAIEAAGPVTTSGNLTVDGRDWGYDGASVTGNGVYGVSSMTSVTSSGSSQIGGNGVAPGNNTNIYEENATWGDSADNDGDAAADEEAWDGLDNDGDGLTDEDTAGYPSDPDVALGLASGTLKTWAQAYDTYFTSEAAINAYIAANGGVLPGGKVYYLEFDNWTSVDFGAQDATYDPSIMVMHNGTGTAEMKNLHGTFRGLLMADFITHINGDATILGSIKSFADSTIGNAYGNGNAKVLFSSAVLASLPTDPTGGTFTRISWREMD